MRKGDFLLRLPISEKNKRDNRAADIEARFLFHRLDLGGGSGGRKYGDYQAHKKI